MTARPNIVLLIIDSLRARHLHSYGYHRQTTPVMDQIGAEGVVFDACFAQAPFTMGSTASVYTGSYASTHRTLYYDDILPTHFQTLPEALNMAGYQTAAFVSNPHINEYSGYTRGVDYFTEARPWIRRQSRFIRNMSRHVWGEDAERLTSVMSEYITSVTKQPFFALGFFIDTHTPFSQSATRYRKLLPEGQFDRIQAHHRAADFYKHEMNAADIRTIIDMYDAEARWVDLNIQKVVHALQQAGLWENTLLVITADHGEGFDTRPWRGGHGQLYENGVHVPLIMHWPAGISSPRRISTLVGLIDLYPTFVELSQGATLPSHVQGVSLFGAMTGKDDIDRQAIYSETGYRRMIRTARWKYINNEGGADLTRRQKLKAGRLPEEKEELYDLQADLAEEKNVIAQESAVTKEMQQNLHTFIKQYVVQGEMDHRDDFDAEFLQRLRGLGYID